jgi:hypothetical protein
MSERRDDCKEKELHDVDYFFVEVRLSGLEIDLDVRRSNCQNWRCQDECLECLYTQFYSHITLFSRKSAPIVSGCVGVYPDVVLTGTLGCISIDCCYTPFD